MRNKIYVTQHITHRCAIGQVIDRTRHPAPFVCVRVYVCVWGVWWSGREECERAYRRRERNPSRGEARRATICSRLWEGKEEHTHTYAWFSRGSRKEEENISSRKKRHAGQDRFDQLVEARTVQEQEAQEIAKCTSMPRL